MNKFASRCTRPSPDKKFNSWDLCRICWRAAHRQLFGKGTSKDSTQHNTSAFCDNDRGMELLCANTTNKENNCMYSYLKTKTKLPLHRLLSSSERFVWAYRFRSVVSADGDRPDQQLIVVLLLKRTQFTSSVGDSCLAPRAPIRRRHPELGGGPKQTLRVMIHQAPSSAPTEKDNRPGPGYSRRNLSSVAAK